MVRLARLVGLGEELDGGEATDAELGGDGLVLSGIEFSNDDGVTERLVVGELFVSGLHTDAVAAPGGEELNHDVLFLVEDDFVEVIGGQLDDFGVDEGDGEDGNEGDFLSILKQPKYFNSVFSPLNIQNTECFTADSASTTKKKTATVLRVRFTRPCTAVH